ncbi:MAG: hypothetical protein IKQ82_05285, partial [Lentisphaeria bacterium]|nr:hypothetical protein [Lentisphaeria bacterium]
MPSEKTSLFPSKTAFRGLDAERTLACTSPDGSPPPTLIEITGRSYAKTEANPRGTIASSGFSAQKRRKLASDPFFYAGRLAFFAAKVYSYR